MEENIIELADGLTVEEIRALFYADALREPSYKLYQLNRDGYRLYYRDDSDGNFLLYPSVTTLLRETTPTPPHLLKWMLEQGPEAAEEKRDMAAAYGTFMHAQFEKFLINRSYPLDDVSDIVRAWFERENIADKYLGEWCRKIRKDLLSFCQFVRDYNVRPLAVEIGLCSDAGGYAGCIDLPCIMTHNGEDFPAIVDFKSGRKGFFEDHELQLELYRMMWNENFPDKQITRIFNFSPKDWRKSPTYNLKEQTQAKSMAKIPHLLALAAIAGEEEERSVTVIHGTLQIDGVGFEENLKELSIAELIKEKRSLIDKVAEMPAV